jgi:uncharacterized membrane protein
LGINRKIEIFSDMELEIEPVNEPDEWALNIYKALEIVEKIIGIIKKKELKCIKEYL